MVTTRLLGVRADASLGTVPTTRPKHAALIVPTWCLDNCDRALEVFRPRTILPSTRDCHEHIWAGRIGHSQRSKIIRVELRYGRASDLLISTFGGEG